MLSEELRMDQDTGDARLADFALKDAEVGGASRRKRRTICIRTVGTVARAGKPPVADAMTAGEVLLCRSEALRSAVADLATLL